jgi:hypothetical protein
VDVQSSCIIAKVIVQSIHNGAYWIDGNRKGPHWSSQDINRAYVTYSIYSMLSKYSILINTLTLTQLLETGDVWWLSILKSPELAETEVESDDS